jgi:hypothetical protein
MAVARSARRWLPDPDAWRRLFLDPEARRQFPNSEERWRWLPDPEGERCQGPGAGERQRHSLGKRASGNIAPEAGRRRCRTPRPERRRHTITHERRCGPPPPPRGARRPPPAGGSSGVHGLRKERVATVPRDILRSGTVRAS